jgi:hypothetical protein
MASPSTYITYFISSFLFIMERTASKYNCMEDYKYYKSQKVMNLCIWLLPALDTFRLGSSQRAELRKQS